MPNSPRGDFFARFVGFVVFCGGILVIGVVLRLAYDLWQDPNLGAGSAAKGFEGVAAGFARLLARIGLLLLGSLSGSLIATKGIQFYSAASRGAAAPPSSGDVDRTRELTASPASRV